ncbi:hypothetical protein H78_02253 [Pseudomonas protegens]|uniref:hypothetical protein n=1 Tax=Pseudomonas protegens TaxID=380021 RepID=UPI00098D3EEC|nr:hypothetical protein [Pseudomonas protegens]AQT08927.1 hypothetical protein H78_02253 [Pseudomonas protegens]GED78346.1 hypothetical protein PFL02_51960 [Pseudomonas fluorescens]
MGYEKLNHKRTWAELVDANEEAAKNSGRQGSFDAQVSRLTLGMYKLYCFCERLRNQYNSPWLEFSAVEAARLYLINKYHWYPTKVKDLNLREILPVLQVELVQLRLTDEELQPVRDWAGHLGAWEELHLAAQPAE